MAIHALRILETSCITRLDASTNWSRGDAAVTCTWAVASQLKKTRDWSQDLRHLQRLL